MVSVQQALYNNLKSAQLKVAESPAHYAGTIEPDVDLALQIDRAVKTHRPDGWRGIQAKEQVVKKALYDVLGDGSEVERLFPIIKAQSEY